MKVGHTLVFLLLFLALQDGDAGDYGDYGNAGNVYRRMEGESITVKFSFYFSGEMMYFCRENCEGENLLIKTEDYNKQNGRYSMRFEKNYVTDNHVYVSIRDLRKSDSGRYRCGLKRFGTDSEKEFEIVVEAPPSSLPKWTLQPSSSSFPTSATKTSSAPTTERPSSTSGPSSSSSPSSTSSAQSGSAPRSGTLLAVLLVLLIMIIGLSAALLVFCRRRSSGPAKEPAVENRFSKGPQDQVYEEIREDRVDARYSKAQRMESPDEYSLASAPQNKVEGDSLDYSEVQFSNGGSSLHSAPVVMQMWFMQRLGWTPPLLTPPQMLP